MILLCLLGHSIWGAHVVDTMLHEREDGFSYVSIWICSYIVAKTIVNSQYTKIISFVLKLLSDRLGWFFTGILIPELLELLFCISECMCLLFDGWLCRILIGIVRSTVTEDMCAVIMMNSQQCFYIYANFHVEFRVLWYVYGLFGFIPWCILHVGFGVTILN